MASISALRFLSGCRKDELLCCRHGGRNRCGSEAYNQGCLYTNHTKKLAKLRNILVSNGNPLESMIEIDFLQRIGIDYHYKEEIEEILASIYKNFGADWYPKDSLSQVSLFFRLLRQGGYPVNPSVFNRFLDTNGGFNKKLSKDIKGLMSLHEASQLNKGEDILYRANEFSSMHLKSSICYLENNIAGLICHAIQHPHHMSLQRYKARYYLSHCKRTPGMHGYLHEIARVDFNIVQSINQKEVEEISCWWNSMGFSRELEFARNQPVKWYLWPMAMLPSPQFSIHRIELAKVIAFIYLIDDIFDVCATLEELHLFVAAIEKWDFSALDHLPTYMRVCYRSLLNITDDTASIVFKKTGWNPINSLKKMWATLCNAFLQEAKWFSAKHVPNVDEYLRNGIVSSGIHVVLVNLFFLLGEGITKENVNLIESNPTLISNISTILRLWDDLGSAKDENQIGFDGSYVECFMKEYQCCSTQTARDHVMNKISTAWESLNNECFSPSSFSPSFLEASLNCARMVKVMYSYDGSQHLPILDEYTNALLLKSI